MAMRKCGRAIGNLGALKSDGKVLMDDEKALKETLSSKK